MIHEAEQGGTFQGSTFKTGNQIGKFVVTARAFGKTNLYRRAYVQVGEFIWVDDPNRVNIVGDWNRVEKNKDDDDSTFNNVYYTTKKSGSDNKVQFTQVMPAGEYDIFLWKASASLGCA